MNYLSFAQSPRASKGKKVIDELSRSLEEGKPDELLVKDYENLAFELIENKEYAQAEENFIKAKNIFIKLKKEDEVARIERELAKLQEMQNHIDEAIATYQSASKISKNKRQQAINTSDANRLMNQSNSLVQSEYINKKIELLEVSDYSKDEMSDAYRQMAQVNLELNQPEAAISNYEAALKETRKPEDEIKITREIAHVYVDYFENSNDNKGEQLLLQAYNRAIAQAQTLEAKQSMELLAAYYQKNKRQKAALNIYSDFVNKLDTLIKSDSSLVDSKVFQINEEKIAQLEKERMLKDELLRKKNSFNTILIATLALILIFLFFIIRAWLSIKVKNKKIALQSLRREMNPHFIFNSLNSVNQFIAQNNELEANKYLSSYSKLMRTIMENSNKDFIPLSIELEQMKQYLQLENMRFGDKFTYSVEVDNELDTDAVFIPNMLIQPQLENAIWHGLRYREEKGHLLLKINKEGNHLSVIIEDNGIGIQKSKKWKTPRQKEHKSRGLKNTYERIELLNKLYHTKINLEIKEKEGAETGMIVQIQTPLFTHENTKCHC
jgi:hypothetical protein